MYSSTHATSLPQMALYALLASIGIPLSTARYGKQVRWLNLRYQLSCHTMPYFIYLLTLLGVLRSSSNWLLHNCSHHIYFHFLSWLFNDNSQHACILFYCVIKSTCLVLRAHIRPISYVSNDFNILFLSDAQYIILPCGLHNVDTNCFYWKQMICPVYFEYTGWYLSLFCSQCRLFYYNRNRLQSCSLCPAQH